MSMHLVVARCGRSPLLMGDLDALSEDDRAALLDATSTDAECALATRLPSGRFAVGRREGARCAWWVGGTFPVEPPHTLWIEHGLFTADGEASLPTFSPDRLLPALAALDGVARAAKTVAGAVRLLRSGTERLCIVASAPQESLEALALTVVAVLGPDLTVAVGHPEPDPARYRLVVGPAVIDGYEPLLAADPPDEGDDLVAWYARDRLRTDPAVLFGAGGVSEETVREALRAGTIDGASGREGRVRALTARIRAGAELDPVLLDELMAVSEVYGDARPWLALQRRPSVVRRAAVEAVLGIARQLRPTEAMLDALSAVYPRGAPLEPWCIALLDWARRSKKPEPFILALERALDEWPQSAARANRVSVWSELVQLLVEREKFRQAEQAVTGPVAETLVREGSGVAVATLWGSLPADYRNPRRLAGLVELLVRHPEGDRAAAQLYRHVKDNHAEVELLLKTWLRTRGARGVDDDDALFQVVAHTEDFGRWLEVAVELHPPASVVGLLPRVATGPEDPLWLAAEAALATTVLPEQRFANLAFLTSGLVALEPLARALVEGALAGARFPDLVLSETARQLVDVPGSAPMWPWVAVAASRPGRFDDDVLDGTVVALCEEPPTNGIERQVCVQVAERLGGAAEWEPLAHARWIVRLALAPDGDHTGFAETLLVALVAGLTARFDAGPHVARVTIEMLDQLPIDHPALVGFLAHWLPEAWRGRVPAPYVEAVEAHGVPPTLRESWEQLKC
ncbi:MAG: hypothetical protein R3F61_07815 [Myxococcota bacterium]